MSNERVNITGALEDIANHLKETGKKVQLIYAFNGTGKTRLSRAFKEIVDPKNSEEDENEEEKKHKILYYNAFTEDLFSWDNDLENDEERKLKIYPNYFTDWIIGNRGLEDDISDVFQKYTSKNITFEFIPVEEIKVKSNDKREKTYTYPEIKFSYNAGDSSSEQNIKISKGEESCFVWSVFYSLLQEVIELRNENDSDSLNEEFNNIEYVFIDDPVSSLDDNHLIELAVDIAKLIKSAPLNLKFIITTHNPLFYNVLSNEFNINIKNPSFKNTEETPNIEKWIYNEGKHFTRYIFTKNEDSSYNLKPLGRKTPFSYHLQLLREIQSIKNNSNQFKKYHLNFLRNILEKMATFLGYAEWKALLPKVNNEPDPHLNRLLNLSSHSAHSGDEIADLQENDKTKLIELVNYLETTYHFSKLNESNT